RVALVEDRELYDVDFDLARRQLGVLVGATALHDAANAHDPLVPEGTGPVVSRARLLPVTRELGVEHELRDPFAVAQVDEHAAAVVAIARHPSEEHDRRAFVARA